MSAPQLYGPNGQALPLGIGRAVAAYAAGGASRSDVAYRAGSIMGQAVAGWLPAQTSADGGWRWSRDLAVARTRDLIANEPWAQAGVDSKVDLIVGSGWMPVIKPDADALGISREAATKLGQQIKTAWNMWANDPLARCDAEGKLTAGWLFHVAVMEQVVSGDALGVLRWKDRKGWPFRTALHLVDSDRLNNPSGMPDTPELRQGVEKDASGEPIAYHVRNGHPGDLGLNGGPDSFTWSRIPRREPWGRPVALHLARFERPGQTRGISKLVAALARFKQVHRQTDAEVANATINALMAATIESSLDPNVLAGQLSDDAMLSFGQWREDLYTKNPVYFGDSKMIQLPPGDKVTMNSSPRGTADFKMFVNTLLGSFAASMGLMRQHLTMDWSDTNYSSARAALVEVWRNVQTDRAVVRMHLADPLLLAVIEDAIDHGMIDVPEGAPDLYEMPAAWIRGRWIGPARGWVDPVKEAQGSLLKIAGGLSDYETELAEQGVDMAMHVENVIDGISALRAGGIDPPAVALKVPGLATPLDQTDASDPAPLGQG